MRLVKPVNYWGIAINPLIANFTKWSNTLKQFVSKLQTNCLSVFDHFVGLVLKEIIHSQINLIKFVESWRDIFYV